MCSHRLGCCPQGSWERWQRSTGSPAGVSAVAPLCSPSTAGCSRGTSRAGLRTQPGSGLQQHRALLFPFAPTQSLLNPYPPSCCFQSPSALALGHLFFMNVGRHWRSMAGKGSAGRRCCPWAGWPGQSRAALQPLPFLPAPKCSCDANVGLRACTASETIALRVLMFV